MSLSLRLNRYIALPTNHPELLVAQLQAFSRQIPLLYFVLLLNIFFVSFGHRHNTPKWLHAYLPVAFSVVACIRIASWWKKRKTEVSALQAEKRIISTIALTSIFGMTITIWGQVLFNYGTPYQQAHVIFFIAITYVSCAFCLMHLRPAVIALACVCMIPFVVRFMLDPIPEMKFIAVNMFAVTTVMLIVILSNYNDFARMVIQRKVLFQQQLKTKALSDANHLLALHDSLTKLPNRRSFFDEIKGCLQSQTSSGKSFSMALLDLDDFKSVNDLYGHHVGDGLLQQVSERFFHYASKDVFIARLSGDEFGIIFRKPNNALGTCQSICHSMTAPFHVDDVTLEISASCGLITINNSGWNERELLEYVDFALYESKSNAAGLPVEFTNRHRDLLLQDHRVNQELRNGDLATELFLHYQPIVKRETGEVSSFEALARWQSPVLGNVSPAQFIVIAERSTVINKVTIILLKRLLSDLAQCPKSMRVSFNLSARCLTDSQTMLAIVSLIDRSKIDAKRIEFEVTETAVMKDFESALRGLALLRNLGCTIALDDFGTGYSSLSYVRLIPLDKIKIDRRFVLDVENNTKTQEIVRTIVNLSRNLKIACVVEGVETSTQADILAACGCSLMQGYLYSKPLLPRDALEVLESNAFRTVQMASY